MIEDEWLEASYEESVAADYYSDEEYDEYFDYDPADYDDDSYDEDYVNDVADREAHMEDS